MEALGFVGGFLVGGVIGVLVTVATLIWLDKF
jgi:hypothetical protein